jgi:peroxidase
LNNSNNKKNIKAMKQQWSTSILFPLAISGGLSFLTVSASATNNNYTQFDLTENGSPTSRTRSIRGLGGFFGNKETISLTEVRPMDGTGNHPDNIGAVGSLLLRLSGVDYPDDDHTGQTMIRQGPNPRDISNIVIHQDGQHLPSSAGLTDAVWAWGQFLDHDISLTDASPDNGSADIPVTGADDLLNPLMRFNRGNHVMMNGVRAPFNQLTAFLDASMVYGSDVERAAALRTFSDGKLKTSDGNLMPFNVDGLPNGGSVGSPANNFLGGDVRVNENVVLTSIHTLFVREHNRLADIFNERYPMADDESVYQLVRKVIMAEIQKITYDEFLPALLGEHAPSGVQIEYNPNLIPTVAIEFSTALFRVGHTLLSTEIMVGDDDDQETISLKSAFANVPFIRNKPENVGRLLLGLSVQPCQEIDNMIVEDVRTFLFLPSAVVPPPNPKGLDLASLNIQRGREQGLPGYNRVRRGYGLAPVRDFSDISSNQDVQDKLSEAYATVDDIDAWVGAISEDHLSGANVGPLIAAALVDQFTRLRDGDRLFYTNDPDLNEAWIAEYLPTVTFGSLVRLNTEQTTAPLNMFFMNG